MLINSLQSFAMASETLVHCNDGLLSQLAVIIRYICEHFQVVLPATVPFESSHNLSDVNFITYLRRLRISSICM